MHETTGCVDEQGLALFLTLLQDNDTSGDGHPEEQVGRQLDHRVDVVVLYEILPYFLLRATTVQHAGELYDSGRSLLGEP